MIVKWRPASDNGNRLTTYTCSIKLDLKESENSVTQLFISVLLLWLKELLQFVDR